MIQNNCWYEIKNQIRIQTEGDMHTSNDLFEGQGLEGVLASWATENSWTYLGWEADICPWWSWTVCANGQGAGSPFMGPYSCTAVSSVCPSVGFFWPLSVIGGGGGEWQTFPDNQCLMPSPLWTTGIANISMIHLINIVETHCVKLSSELELSEESIKRSKSSFCTICIYSVMKLGI